MLLSPPPYFPAQPHDPQVVGIELTSSCLLSKDSASWVTSPVSTLAKKKEVSLVAGNQVFSALCEAAMGLSVVSLGGNEAGPHFKMLPLFSFSWGSEEQHWDQAWTHGRHS